MAFQKIISFIGSGNLAWHLAPALENAGYIVKEVYSRNPGHAGRLTERLYQAEIKASLDFSTSNSEIFIIAVSDDAIQDIAREIILPEDATLIHTSGSKPLAALQYAACLNLGVLYPLQTFSQQKRVDFSNVPLFVEASNENTRELIFQLAKSISKNVVKITSEERKSLHLAAVFASNFTNHMLTISKDLMKQNSLDFEWMKPLITEVLTKSLTLGPEKTQTGPAMRGDLQTLDSHMELLRDDEKLVEIYRVISQHIIDRYEPD